MARVLLVDDNLLIRTQLRQILSEAGHEVVGEAEDGLEAPGCVRELDPDLVLLDIVMPGRGGLDALQHMLMIHPSLAVVVCSGTLDQRHVLAALRRGAKGFIVKPFERDAVLGSIDAALGEYATG